MDRARETGWLMEFCENRITPRTPAQLGLIEQGAEEDDQDWLLRMGYEPGGLRTSSGVPGYASIYSWEARDADELAKIVASRPGIVMADPLPADRLPYVIMVSTGDRFRYFFVATCDEYYTLLTRLAPLTLYDLAEMLEAQQERGKKLFRLRHGHDATGFCERCDPEQMQAYTTALREAREARNAETTQQKSADATGLLQAGWTEAQRAKAADQIKRAGFVVGDYVISDELGSSLRGVVSRLWPRVELDHPYANAGCALTGIRDRPNGIDAGYFRKMTPAEIRQFQILEDPA